MRGDFGADFVTAFADTGAEGGADVGGLGAEIGVHFFDGAGNDGGDGAAPTGVDGGNGALVGVKQEDGNAIGSADADPTVEIVGDQGIAFALAIG